MLAAMRDSPIACQTHGMNLTAVKLQVFGLSALLAGAAGAVMGSLQVRVGILDFLYFKSLSVLLVATIFGITSMLGAFLGALFFAVLPEVTRHSGSRGGLALQPLIIGALAMATARRPEGIAGRLRNWLRPLWQRPPNGVEGRAVEPALVEPSEEVPVAAHR
jgi:branched-chain amino acid transport system permease protein